jgi:hypothetical protein
MGGSCSKAAAATRRMNDDALSAIKAPGSIDQQWVDFRLAIAATARPCSAAYRLEKEATALWREPTVKLQ